MITESFKTNYTTIYFLVLQTLKIFSNGYLAEFKLYFQNLLICFY